MAINTIKISGVNTLTLNNKTITNITSTNLSTSFGWLINHEDDAPYPKFIDTNNVAFALQISSNCINTELDDLIGTTISNFSITYGIKSGTGTTYTITLVNGANAVISGDSQSYQSQNTGTDTYSIYFFHPDGIKPLSFTAA